MNFVIFDTETTGLLQPENSDLTMQPKIIEFYGVRLDEEFQIQDEFESLISPNEPISSEISSITKITNDMLEGKPSFDDVHEDISRLMHGVDLAVAHNIAFDNGMLDVEYRRLDKPAPMALKNLCTVEATMGMTGYRLSLTRLHWILFQTQFAAHRAKDDVHALVRCFHQLTENGVIDLNEYNSN